VWDLEGSTSLAALGADARLTPASLSKIMVPAAALSTWPPDKTFATELRATALPRDGQLRGDLVLRGSGDATLDETTLWGLAAQLRAAGLKQVSGRVVVERAPFGELGCDTLDRCRALRRSSRAYNAAPSAIGVNYGSWCIAVRGQASGQPAQVEGDAPDWAALAHCGLTLVIYMGVRDANRIQQELLAGLSADTPVAVIQNASLPDQRHAVTSLEHLHATLVAEQLGSPSVIVVGDVVRGIAAVGQSGARRAA